MRNINDNVVQGLCPKIINYHTKYLQFTVLAKQLFVLKGCEN